MKTALPREHRKTLETLVIQARAVAESGVFVLWRFDILRRASKYVPPVLPGITVCHTTGIGHVTTTYLVQGKSWNRPQQHHVGNR